MAKQCRLEDHPAYGPVQYHKEQGLGQKEIAEILGLAPWRVNRLMDPERVRAAQRESSRRHYYGTRHLPIETWLHE